MNKILLIDSNSILHRAYHALPNLASKSGQYTGAIFGFLNIFLRLVEQETPTHVAAVFDAKAKTFRHEMFAEYKGTRKPMDFELAMQFEPLKKILALMNVKVIEKPGFEADDIIGTLARRFDEPTFIVTGDRDSFQLVSPTTKVMWTKVGVTSVEIVDETYLKGMGFISTDQFIDFKALMGDPSDNIPGISGVGEKTALSLLQQYVSLDGVYEHADEIKGKIGEKIRAGKESAYLSKKLATIDTDVPIDISLNDIKLNKNYSSQLKEYLSELELNSIVKKLDFEPTMAELASEEISSEEFEKLLSQKFDKTALILGDELKLSFDGQKEYVLKLKDDLFSNGLSFDEALSKLKGINGKVLIADAKSAIVEHGLYFEDFYDVLIGEHLASGSESVKSIVKVLENHGLPYNAASYFRLYESQQKILNEQDMQGTLDVELKLLKVLAEMQTRGIAVNSDTLDSLEKEYTVELAKISDEIKEYAGESVNISSPKQIATLLFDTLKLKHGRKNHSGGYSVDEEVLSQIDHPVASLILDYRRVAKLLSTYVTGLKAMVKDGRVHTEFNQTITMTGRLSSTNPNLQNIPVKGRDAKKIKSAFVAGDGAVLLSCDYSQIELRLLAHFSGDEKLIEAFRRGDDIHTQTASKVFGVPPEAVSPELRKSAKAVNFGIVYGISDFGLSQNLSIPRYMAKSYIDAYFDNYKTVKEYLDGNVKFAKENGYVSTLLKRRRYLTDINAKNFNLAQQSARMAMNTPLQGSAADIVKLAMINIEEKLKGFKSKMILQIHDELIFEVPLGELDEVMKIVKSEMENVVKLSVPLVVDSAYGSNWGEIE